MSHCGECGFVPRSQTSPEEKQKQEFSGIKQKNFRLVDFPEQQLQLRAAAAILNAAAEQFQPDWRGQSPYARSDLRERRCSRRRSNTATSSPGTLDFPKKRIRPAGMIRPPAFIGKRGKINVPSAETMSASDRRREAVLFPPSTTHLSFAGVPEVRQRRSGSPNGSSG